MLKSIFFLFLALILKENCAQDLLPALEKIIEKNSAGSLVVPNDLIFLKTDFGIITGLERDTNGNTLMHLLCAGNIQKDNLSIVKLYLDFYNNALEKNMEKILNNQGENFLHSAIASSKTNKKTGWNLGVIDLLSKQNGMINAKTFFGETPLHLALMHYHQQTIKIVSKLLAYGAKIELSIDNDNVSVLHWACHHGNLELITLLLKDNSLINLKSNFNTTPLSNAVNAGNVEVVSLLINYGVDVNAKIFKGDTVLHYAYFYLQEHPKTRDQIVKLLIDNNADQSVLNDDNLRPIQYMYKGMDLNVTQKSKRSNQNLRIIPRNPNLFVNKEYDDEIIELTKNIRNVYKGRPNWKKITKEFSLRHLNLQIDLTCLRKHLQDRFFNISRKSRNYNRVSSNKRDKQSIIEINILEEDSDSEKNLPPKKQKKHSTPSSGSSENEEESSSMEILDVNEIFNLQNQSNKLIDQIQATLTIIFNGLIATRDLELNQQNFFKKLLVNIFKYYFENKELNKNLYDELSSLAMNILNRNFKSGPHQRIEDFSYLYNIISSIIIDIKKLK